MRSAHDAGIRWENDLQKAVPGKILNQLKEPIADLSGDPFWNAYLDEIEAYKPGSNLQQANIMVPEKFGTFVNV